MNKKNLSLFVVVALLFAAVGIYAGTKRTATGPAQPAAVGQLLGQTMNDPAGKPQPLSQWKGQTLVVNFWATWCAPCVEEMPELSALQTELGAGKTQIIGIGIDSPSNIREFAAKHKISYPLYVGGIEASELSRQLGNQAGGLPFTVVVGPDGSVKKTFLGRLKMNELRAELTRL
jgi:thiol-disulfide isomerase/thioredoxin